MLTTSPKNQEIIDAADQCVMCGLCLPHCPTYIVAKNEAESPRGRIALVRALHEGKLNPNPILVNHLDQCLGCMTCQAVCPANVKYEKILDAGREITRDQHSLLYSLQQSLLLFVLTKASAHNLVKNMLKMYHCLGINHLLSKLYVRFPYALRLFTLIPKPQKINLPTPIISKTTKKTRVALVNSCASDLFSDAIKAAAKFILQALNCEIVKENQVNCCGALHQHSGNLKQAKVLMQKFSEPLINENFDILVSMATGCGAQLNRYPEFLNDTFATKLIDKHMDINNFVLEQLEKHKLAFKPLPKQVYIHKPCTQKFVTNNLQVVEQLLSEIPEIQLSFFQDDLACCGAGGINTLTQAKLADNLINSKITELKSSDATYLVTSNIGCALHFQTQLQGENSPIIVCHPITLLAQQLLYSKNA